MASACDQRNGIERSADNVIRIPLPEHPPIACVRVQSGDTVILPFDVADSYNLQVKEVDGFLVIDGDGTTIFIQGLPNTIDEHGNPSVIFTASTGVVIDIALLLAETDPNIDIVQ